MGNQHQRRKVQNDPQGRQHDKALAVLGRDIDELGKERGEENDVLRVRDGHGKALDKPAGTQVLQSL